MDTIGNTWKLYKQSFNFLNADVEIVLFPVMSGISTILLAAGFFFPLFRSGLLREFAQKSAPSELYLLLFAWYYLNYLVIIFFNSALVGCAHIRISGGDPTVRDGMRIAIRHLDRIAYWAFIAATVGVILGALRNKGKGFIGKLLAGGLGLAWTLVTYLIIPVIILEDRTTYESMQRSAELFNKRWGEQIAGTFGFGVLNVLLVLPAVALGLLLYRVDPALAVITVVCYILILAAISSAVRGVFTVVLYRYASTGNLPGAFSSRQIDGILGAPQKPSWDQPL
jgi:hypothetical protein